MHSNKSNIEQITVQHFTHHVCSYFNSSFIYNFFHIFHYLLPQFLICYVRNENSLIAFASMILGLIQFAADSLDIKHKSIIFITIWFWYCNVCAMREHIQSVRLRIILNNGLRNSEAVLLHWVERYETDERIRLSCFLFLFWKSS